MAEVEINAQVFVVGDVSRPFQLFTGLNLAAYAYSDMTVRVRRPDGTYFNLTVTAIDEAASGTLAVNTGVVGNLNQTGMYIWQAKALKAANPTLYSDCGHFIVEAGMSGL